MKVADEGEGEVIGAAGAGDEAVGGFDVAATVPDFAGMGDGFDDFEVFGEDMAKMDSQFFGFLFEALGVICFKTFFFDEYPNFHGFGGEKKKGAPDRVLQTFSVSSSILV